MSEITQLKQELKAWERAFRESHGGSDPTKEDSKRDHTIAAKYKLYRSLTKNASKPGDSTSPQTAFASISSGQNQSSTQSTSKLGTSLLFVKRSAATKLASGAPTSNPFSPVKRSNQKKPSARSLSREITPDEDVVSSLDPRHDPNPFLESPSNTSHARKSALFSQEPSHTEATPRLSRELMRSSSPPPFPLIRQSPGIISQSPQVQRGNQAEAGPSSRRQVNFTTPHKHQPLTGDVSSSGFSEYTPKTKARKRMRGELLYTPSESRRKKVRVGSQEAPVDFLPRGGGEYGSGEEDTPFDDINSSVDEPTALPDSPVKRLGGLPTNRNQSIDDSKSFRALFDDLPTRKSDSFKPDSADPLRSRSTVRSRSKAPVRADNQQDAADISRRTDLGGSEEVVEATHESHSLLLPSPPPHDKAARASASTSRQSGATTARKKKSIRDPDVEMIDPVTSSKLAAEDDSDISTFIMTRAVPWQAVQTRKIPPGGFEDAASPAIEDEGVEGIGQLFSKLNRLSPSPPLPSHPPTDSGAVSQESDLAGDLSHILSMSQIPDAYLEEERHEAMLLQQLLTNGGGKNSSRPQGTSGEVWEVGEGDDAEEDWESEPDGWNASPDL